MAVLTLKRRALVWLALGAALATLGIASAPRRAAASPAPARVGDLINHPGEVTRRLVGYGLVVGLDGTGDRSFGGLSSQSITVHSVVNLLRRFNLEVPPSYLRLRNVAAVLVTAEVSPYLRSGGRFEVSVSALGDAVSLEGGVLWMTPLQTDPNEPPAATAQGTLLVPRDERPRGPFFKATNSARIPDGGLLETDPPPIAADPRIFLRDPDRVTAAHITAAINAALGDGTARVEDPGSIRLSMTGDAIGPALAAIDTLTVVAASPARVVIHSREGLVVAGGDVRLGAAVIHHQGITLEIGGAAVSAADQTVAARNLVHVPADARVEDVAAGLHAIGASSEEIAAIFEALRDAGALRAEVVIR